MKIQFNLLLLLFLGNLSFGQTKFKADTSQWIMYIINRDTMWIPKETPFDVAMKNGDYEKAIELMKNTLKTNPYNQFNSYNLACAYALAGNKDSSFYFLQQSRKTDTTLIFLSDPDFYSLIYDPRWEKLKQDQVNEYEKRNGKLKNRGLTLKLMEMRIKDQAFYRPSQLIESKFGIRKNQQDSLSRLYQPLWDNNLKELKIIIQHIGWPIISEVGRSAALTAFLIIQHSDYDTQKMYEPMMEAAANKGEANWSELALLIDRIRIHENKPQLYGSQVKFNETTKQYEPEPIDDESNLDLRRSKVGLGTAASYYSNWKIKYTVKQNKD